VQRQRLDRFQRTCRRRTGTVLRSLIAPLAEEEFRARYWTQKPLVVHRKDPDYYGDLFTLQDFDEVITRAPSYIKMANAATKKNTMYKSETAPGLEAVLADMRAHLGGGVNEPGDAESLRHMQEIRQMLDLADQAELGGVHAAVLARVVAEPEEPGRRPHHADGAEDRERVPPRHAFEQRGDDRLRGCAAQRRTVPFPPQTLGRVACARPIPA
jgi:hypothetical protein